MSRKIKVVAVENVETVELPPPEPEVAAPAGDAPLGMNSREIEVALPEVESSSSDKPEVVAMEAPKETKTKKKDEKITCPVCNKTMLSKTYKYTHQALCKPKEPTPTPAPKALQPKPKREPKTKTKDVPIVSFNDFKEMKELMPAPDYAAQYRAAREQRQQVRVQRVKSLISQAIFKII